MSEKLYVVSFQGDIRASSPEAAVRVFLHRMQSDEAEACVWTEDGGRERRGRVVRITVAKGQVIRGAKYTEEVSE